MQSRTLAVYRLLGRNVHPVQGVGKLGGKAGAEAWCARQQWTQAGLPPPVHLLRATGQERTVHPGRHGRAGGGAAVAGDLREDLLRQASEHPSECNQTCVGDQNLRGIA